MSVTFTETFYSACYYAICKMSDWKCVAFYLINAKFLPSDKIRIQHGSYFIQINVEKQKEICETAKMSWNDDESTSISFPSLGVKALDYTNCFCKWKQHFNKTCEIIEASLFLNKLSIHNEILRESLQTKYHILMTYIN